jgi:hypothetical protein
LPTTKVDDLGRVNSFPDVGCFQHLDAAQRTSAGLGITTVANPAAALLMMAFSRPTSVVSFRQGNLPRRRAGSRPLLGPVQR